jgi:hypothetical protein
MTLSRRLSRTLAYQCSPCKPFPKASYHNQPHAVCPHGCRHPLTKEPVNVRYGYHLVTDCPKANQGKKSHKDVEAVLINHFNINTHITATNAKF